jgi:protein SCO1/2
VVGRKLAGAAVATALALSLAACGGDEDRPFSGRPLDPPFQVPSTGLTDTDGATYSLADDTDKRLTLVFFGYVNCEDVCPAVLSHLASALTRLDDADRDDVDVVLVTSDPDTDTPESLRTYLDRFNPDFIGLDGDFETIEAIGKDLAVGLDRQDPGGHTTQVLGIDAGDEVPVYWGSATTPAQYAADIHTLLQD